MAQSAAKLGHTTIIDEDGDLTLIVGDTKHRILVASKVLTLVSKVFKAMLSRNFREGQELAAANGKGYELELPDDDPEISVVLLKHDSLPPSVQSYRTGEEERRFKLVERPHPSR